MAKRYHQKRLDLAARDMTHAVEFEGRTLDGQSRVWRVIALFDCERAAVEYRAACIGSIPGNADHYRVLVLT